MFCYLAINLMQQNNIKGVNSTRHKIYGKKLCWGTSQSMSGMCFSLQSDVQLKQEDPRIEDQTGSDFHFFL